MSQVSSDVNKQHSLECRCVNWKEKIMAESIKYQNIHSFKEELILLCQSILETSRITQLHRFTIGSSLYNPFKHIVFLFNTSIKLKVDLGVGK